MGIFVVMPNGNVPLGVLSQLKMSLRRKSFKFTPKVLI